MMPWKNKSIQGETMLEPLSNRPKSAAVDDAPVVHLVQQLLEQADNAMYQAKRLGGGTCRFSLLNRPAD